MLKIFGTISVIERIKNCQRSGWTGRKHSFAKTSICCSSIVCDITDQILELVAKLEISVVNSLFVKLSQREKIYLNKVKRITPNLFADFVCTKLLILLYKELKNCQ